MQMIPAIVGYVTRREGRKFRRLNNTFNGEVIMGEGRGKEIPALYVHIPFCKLLCPFCCFNRYLFQEDLARRYFIDLKKELEIYIQHGFRFSSVYLGGGTPTVLMDELSGLIEHLRAKSNIQEISLETTPRELTVENIKLLKQAGINRLSIGVQSFDERVLKAMGRFNGPAEEVKDRLLKAEGQFDTLNVDFVFNFPGQNIEQFTSDITTFKELGIDQATFYPLMASPHKKDALERRFNRVDNSRERQFYDVILTELYRGGYSASTAWCFSRGKRMIDEYIIESDDYIGIGAGSVSITGGKFLVNSFSLDRYHEMTEAGRFPVVGWRQLSEKENQRYYLLTKLFGLKLDRGAFRERFGGDIAEKLRMELAFFKKSGLIAGDGTLHVTEKGMYPVSVMIREFFGALNGLREYCIEKQI
jgi:coproporphyrinogen III oxidase-like Fe-S oxidoreductase